MAQNILHRRSAIAGKIPTTGSLLVGEIGLNTYDGTAYIHKSGAVNTIEQLVVTNSPTTGSIIIIGTGSFSELIITQDANVHGGLYVNGDIVGNGDLDILGAVTASFFIGDGKYLTGVTASMRPDDYDFNSDPFAGTVGYLQGTGSLYKVATDSDAIDFRYNDVTIATITNENGYSGSVYGIGDVLAFSGSIALQIAALQYSASILDAGSW